MGARRQAGLWAPSTVPLMSTSCQLEKGVRVHEGGVGIIEKIRGGVERRAGQGLALSAGRGKAGVVRRMQAGAASSAACRSKGSQGGRGLFLLGVLYHAAQAGQEDERIGEATPAAGCLQARPEAGQRSGRGGGERSGEHTPGQVWG